MPPGAYFSTHPDFNSSDNFETRKLALIFELVETESRFESIQQLVLTPLYEGLGTIFKCH